MSYGGVCAAMCNYRLWTRFFASPVQGMLLSASGSAQYAITHAPAHVVESQNFKFFTLLALRTIQHLNETLCVNVQ